MTVLGISRLYTITHKTHNNKFVSIFFTNLLASASPRLVLFVESIIVSFLSFNRFLLAIMIQIQWQHIGFNPDSVQGLFWYNHCHGMVIKHLEMQFVCVLNFMDVATVCFILLFFGCVLFHHLLYWLIFCCTGCRMQNLARYF